MKTSTKTASSKGVAPLGKDKEEKGLHGTLVYMRQHWQLYVIFLLPAFALTIIFRYIPMGGILIAFEDYNAIKGFLGSPFVGFKHFQRFLSSPDFLAYLVNTLKLSIYGLLWGFPIPILLAFLLGFPANEIVVPCILMGYLSAGSLTDYGSLAELHGLLAAMRPSAVVEQSPADGRYRLGIRLFEYGCAVSRGWNILEAAAGPMGWVAEETGETVSLAALDRGERILIPKFEFARQMRSDIKSQPLQLGRDEIAIFEGIHALNDIISGRNPQAAKVYISARSDILGESGEAVFKRTWLRLERRAVRDGKFRAWKADVTVRMWANVRRGEKLYISPFKDNATIVFDSSLPYEVNVIRAFAQPLFDHLRVSPDMERYEEVRQLAEAYPRFEILDESYVAPDSLIREFIGGGIYDD